MTLDRLIEIEEHQFPGIQDALDYRDELVAAVRSERAKVRMAREALEPLAKLDVRDLEQRPDGTPIYRRNETAITVGDVRAARAAIEKIGEGE